MNYKDLAVGTLEDFADGEMKLISTEGKEILLARVGRKLHAVGATCPHYGAPLVEGVLNGERIICPWHHACFSVTTGELLEPPALDDLASYAVLIEDDQVLIRVPDATHDRTTPQMTTPDTSDGRVFVIVGGGAAGYAAAQTLREDGFKGRVVLITRENELPYDRPNLSKEYLQGKSEPGWLPLRNHEFFAGRQIEIISGREAKRIDAATKEIEFADGEKLVCDGLLVATGGEPRKLPFQSGDEQNVFVLRSRADSDAISDAAETGKRVVIIGANFIGMEVASSLAARGCEVTVVAPGDVPFKKLLGSEIGGLFQHVHEKHGVKFKLGASVQSFIGSNKVEVVVLETRERLNADIIVVGIGVKPATDLLEGFKLHKDGGVIVDEHLRAADGVYAAGDIAYFPSIRTGQSQRIEHWRTAMQQGRTAAHNMVGKDLIYDAVPFFWTRQFDMGLLYVGHAATWTEIIFQGDISKHDFLAFYVKDDRVLAVAGMNRDAEIAAIEELMRLDKMPSPNHFRDNQVNAVDLLRHPSLGRHLQANVHL